MLNFNTVKWKQAVKPILLYLLSLAPAVSFAVDSVDIAIDAETEVNVQQFQARSDDVLLWLPSESGLLEQEKAAAETLAHAGLPVWLAYVLNAWFLPALPSSLEALPADKIAVLVEKVRKLSQKRVYLVAGGRGALLSLRVAQAWQQQFGQQARLGGVIIISPKLFVETPEPGLAGELMPVVKQSNLPVFIIQPSNSPWRWKLDRIVPGLEQSGSDVYTQILPGVRDRFYYRPDATPREDSLATELPQLLMRAVRLLGSFNKKSRLAAQTPLKLAKVSRAKKARVLRAYQGDPQPPTLSLQTLTGQTVDVKDLNGKVVLVNFWASWCPPCVHEMPSMQLLVEHFDGKAFEILAVNMAEDKQTVQTFLQQKVRVRFPILLDSDGSALKRWRVFAFPTSYVIDKKGQIRLALFGAIDWMQESVVEQINKLVDE